MVDSFKAVKKASCAAEKCKIELKSVMRWKFTLIQLIFLLIEIAIFFRKSCTLLTVWYAPMSSSLSCRLIFSFFRCWWGSLEIIYNTIWWMVYREGQGVWNSFREKSETLMVKAIIRVNQATRDKMVQRNKGCHWQFSCKIREKWRKPGTRWGKIPNKRGIYTKIKIQ